MSERSTAATRKRRIDIHPHDTAARLDIMNRLIATRMRTTTRPAVAELLGISPKGVWAFENEPEPNPLLDMAQRYARALGYRLVLTPAGTLQPDPDDPTIAMFAAMTDKGDPRRADELHRFRTMAHLASVRRWNGKTLKDLAAAIGCSESAMAQAEQGHSSPWLSTYQRHARAIGAPLALTLEPAPALAVAA